MGIYIEPMAVRHNWCGHSVRKCCLRTTTKRTSDDVKLRLAEPIRILQKVLLRREGLWVKEKPRSFVRRETVASPMQWLKRFCDNICRFRHGPKMSFSLTSNGWVFFYFPFKKGYFPLSPPRWKSKNLNDRFVFSYHLLNLHIHFPKK